MDVRTKCIVTAVVCAALSSVISSAAFAQAAGAGTNGSNANGPVGDAPANGGTRTDGGSSAQPSDAMGTQTAMQSKEMQRGASGSDADAKLKAQLDKVAAMPEKAGDGLFILENGGGNLWEIELSKAIQSKSQDDKVKELAGMIIKDHTAANEKLTTIAGKMGLELPTMLPSAKQQKLSILQSMPVGDFETAYLLMMKEDHAKDITAFADHEKAVKDEDLRSYISMVLPKLKEHGGHVQMVAAGKGFPAPLGDGGMSGGTNGGNTSVGMPGDPHDTPAGGRPSRDPTAPTNNQNPSNR